MAVQNNVGAVVDVHWQRDRRPEISLPSHLHAWPIQLDLIPQLLEVIIPKYLPVVSSLLVVVLFLLRVQDGWVRQADIEIKFAALAEQPVYSNQWVVLRKKPALSQGFPIVFEDHARVEIFEVGVGDSYWLVQISQFAIVSQQQIIEVLIDFSVLEINKLPVLILETALALRLFVLADWAVLLAMVF